LLLRKGFTFAAFSDRALGHIELNETMKRLTLCILLCLFSGLLFCQTKQNSDDVYQIALENFINYLDSTYKNIDTVLQFEYLPGVTNLLTKKHLSHQIKYIKLDERLLELKAKGNTVFYQIFPLKFENREFKISFSEYILSASGCTVSAIWECKFNFDCKLNKFNFIKINGGGI
jgi:hypothetical protein